MEREESESGNWNINKDYLLQLAVLFAEADYYAEIAKFGFTDLLTSLNTKESDKMRIRLGGFEKYIFKLKAIIKYSWAFVGTHQDDFEQYRKDLDFIEKNTLKKLTKKIPSGMKDKEIMDENLFELSYNKVCAFDTKLREPMNINELIMARREKYNPKEYKKNIKDKLTEEA